MVEHTPSYRVAADLLGSHQNTICFVGYCDPDTPGGDGIEIEDLMQAGFIALTEANYVDRWTYENYTLLGDPATRLRLPHPLEANVTRTDDTWQWRAARAPGPPACAARDGRPGSRRS